MVQKQTSRPDKEIHLAHHQEQLTRWGENVRALGYGNTESQQTRFQVLSEIGSFEGRSVLDVGCGFGDFFGFINKKCKHLRSYVGVDVNPNMIAIAKKRYPNAVFEVRDILEAPIINKFDFVVASGIFNLETCNWEEIVKRMLSEMYELSQIGVGVNFLSTFTKGRKPADSHFADPAEILDFVLRTLSTRVVLRHDYRFNDFTLYIYA
jgi:ubiquinone/menaquinone biosynthesis C-methylase UbiE